MLQSNQIYLGDSLEKLKEIDDNSISLIVSSPPYKDSDGFTYPWIKEIFTELYRVQKDNSLFFCNFGHLAEDKFRPFKVCGKALECGYKLNDTITWVKNHYKPIQGKKRLNNLSEFIFLLYKGEMPELNRLAIGIPYKDKSNAKRFANGLDLKCPGNVWYIPYETITKKEDKLHNDRYPLELPTKCIKLANIQDDDMVLDCFSGSGTTCLAARNLNKRYIGIEKNEHNFNVSINRLNNG